MKLPEAIARQLRRLAGPDPRLARRLLYAEANAGRARDDVAREVAWRREAQRDATRLRIALAEALNVEPGPTEGCTKVRLRDQDEAWEFARRVAEDTGQRFDLFEVYPCNICPRQPVGTSRFLHITSKETTASRTEAKARRREQRKRNGTALGDRIDPAVLARFKDA